MFKDDMDKLEEQEMKKIRSIKQNVMGEKPKIVKDRLKNKIIKIFGHVLKPKGKKKIEKKRSKMKKQLRIK